MKLLLASKKHLGLLFIWFFPILVAASTGRLRNNYGIDSSIVYLLAGSIGFSAFYILIFLRKISLSTNVVLIIFLVFGLMLMSDISEVRFVASLVGYSLAIHIISRKFPLVLWKQYYFVSIAISWLTFVDIASFFIMGDVIFSYRDNVVVVGSLPRVTPIFDEMAHQSFFLMPAAIVAFQNNIKHFFILSMGVLLTLSVSAIVMFVPLLIYFNRDFIMMSVKRISSLVVFILFFLVLFYLSFDFISSKMSHIFNPDLINRAKGSSALNILMTIDFLKEASIYDLMFGFGYFNYEESVRHVFNNSYLYDYYESRGALEQVGLVGVFNFIMKFGLIVLGIVVFLFHNAKRNAIDKRVYSISLIIVLASMVKNSHTVDYFVHLFFLFGLAWGCRGEIQLANKVVKNIPQKKVL